MNRNDYGDNACSTSALVYFISGLMFHMIALDILLSPRAARIQRASLLIPASALLSRRAWLRRRPTLLADPTPRGCETEARVARAVSFVISTASVLDASRSLDAVNAPQPDPRRTHSQAGTGNGTAVARSCKGLQITGWTSLRGAPYYLLGLPLSICTPVLDHPVLSTSFPGASKDELQTCPMFLFDTSLTLFSDVALFRCKSIHTHVAREGAAQDAVT